MKTSQIKKQLKQGSALIAIFWIMTIVGFAVFASISVVKIQADLTTQESHGRRAMQLAEKGVAIAVHGQVKTSDPLLSYAASGGEEGYRATFRSLASTFGINDLIRQAASERAEGQPLENSLLGLIFTEEWGMELQEADLFLGCLVEWVDRDDRVSTLSGWEAQNYEDEGYIGYPFNRYFYHLDELELVEGYEFLENVKPDWRRYFNVWTNSQIDFTDASAEMISLASVVDSGRLISISDAREIVDQVLGDDGIKGTEDDLLNPQPESVLLPYLGDGNASLILQRFSGASQYSIIESTGWSGKVNLTIKMSLQGRGSSPQLLERVESTTYREP